MKINVLQPLLGFDGAPLMQTAPELGPDGKPTGREIPTDEPLLLRHVLAAALNHPGHGYQGESLEAKARRGFLAIQCHCLPELECKVEDAATMKRCVADRFAPVIVFRVAQILDGEGAPAPQ